MPFYSHANGDMLVVHGSNQKKKKEKVIHISNYQEKIIIMWHRPK